MFIMRFKMMLGVQGHQVAAGRDLGGFGMIKGEKLEMLLVLGFVGVDLRCVDIMVICE